MDQNMFAQMRMGGVPAMPDDDEDGFPFPPGYTEEQKKARNAWLRQEKMKQAPQAQPMQAQPPQPQPPELPDWQNRNPDPGFSKEFKPEPWERDPGFAKEFEPPSWLDPGFQKKRPPWGQPVAAGPDLSNDDVVPDWMYPPGSTGNPHGMPQVPAAPQVPNAPDHQQQFARMRQQLGQGMQVPRAGFHGFVADLQGSDEEAKQRARAVLHNVAVQGGDWGQQAQLQHHNNQRFGRDNLLRPSAGRPLLPPKQEEIPDPGLPAGIEDGSFREKWLTPYTQRTQVPYLKGTGVGTYTNTFQQELKPDFQPGTGMLSPEENQFAWGKIKAEGDARRQQQALQDAQQKNPGFAGRDRDVYRGNYEAAVRRIMAESEANGTPMTAQQVAKQAAQQAKGVTEQFQARMHDIDSPEARQQQVAKTAHSLNLMHHQRSFQQDPNRYMQWQAAANPNAGGSGNGERYMAMADAAARSGNEQAAKYFRDQAQIHFQREGVTRENDTRLHLGNAENDLKREDLNIRSQEQKTQNYLIARKDYDDAYSKIGIDNPKWGRAQIERELKRVGKTAPVAPATVDAGRHVDAVSSGDKTTERKTQFVDKWQSAVNDHISTPGSSLYKFFNDDETLDSLYGVDKKMLRDIFAGVSPGQIETALNEVHKGSYTRTTRNKVNHILNKLQLTTFKHGTAFVWPEFLTPRTQYVPDINPKDAEDD